MAYANFAYYITKSCPCQSAEEGKGMPRPKKCRKVCRLPKAREFLPAGGSPDFVILTVDEYESIRLIDGQGFSQEECAAQMQVARTTAQHIYNSAKRKIAAALVEGVGIRIEGGDFYLCDNKDSHEGCENCRKRCKKARKDTEIL